jgi:fimbrial chaperone protein
MTRYLLAAWILLLNLAAEAGALTVNPIRVELAAAQAATSLTVGNAADAPATVQVSVHVWQHRDGVDVLEPATGRDAPIITPPIFRLAPGGSQIVRIGFAGRSTAVDEGRWRLVVEEVPQPELMPVSMTRIATRLRLSLPLFRRPAEPLPALAWALSTDRGALIVENRGNTTERIDRAGLAEAPAPAISGPVYLFPGEQRRYPLATPAPESARLRVDGSQTVDGDALALAGE